ncbi:MAG: hypothetical protein K0B02_00470 [DPANN group archaeon]|nr:hypothetical protein [DPANN group archaeon]
MKRITTGIHGLDDKMEGGLVPGSVVLIAGKAGTCKTSFCSNYIYEGVQRGETSVYITTEEMEDEIKNDLLEVFGWDFREFEKTGLVHFLSIKPIFPEKTLNPGDYAKITKFYTYDITKRIVEAVNTTKATRLIIDSISVFELFIKDKYMAKIALIGLMEALRKTGVTTIVTGEIPESSEGLSKNEIIEFLADAVIKLEFVPVSEDYKRTLTIRKMRRTDHSSMIHPFEITKDGIKIIQI